MTTKSIALAMFVFAAFVAVARVQGAEAQSADIQVRAADTISGKVTEGEFVIGWNLFNPVNCFWHLPGDGSVRFEVLYAGGSISYLSPSGGTFAFVSAVNTLASACQTGNLIAYHVYNSEGDWNAIFTYTFK